MRRGFLFLEPSNSRRHLRNYHKKRSVNQRTFFIRLIEFYFADANLLLTAAQSTTFQKAAT